MKKDKNIVIHRNQKPELFSSRLKAKSNKWECSVDGSEDLYILKELEVYADRASFDCTWEKVKNLEGE